MSDSLNAKKQLLAQYIEKDKEIIEKKEQLLEKYKAEGKVIRVDSLERQISDRRRILREHEGTYDFMRPNESEDIEKRNEILKSYSSIVRDSIPDNVPIVFHGTNNIANVLQIIKTGGLLTPEQRGESMTSFATAIDVTYKNDIHVSCDFAEPGIHSYMPYGAIFVFKPLEDEIENVINTKGSEVYNGVDGVNFINEPDRLISIITTDENKQRIQEWCEKYSWPLGKVYTHEEFIEKCKEMYYTNEKEETRTEQDYTITPNQIGKKSIYAHIGKKDIAKDVVVRKVEERTNSQELAPHNHNGSQGGTNDGR